MRIRFLPGTPTVLGLATSLALLTAAPAVAAPSLAAFGPEPGETSVSPTDDVIWAAFSGPMNQSTGNNMRLWRVKDGAAVAGDVSWKNANTLLFHPDRPLAANTRYVVTINSYLKDTAGNRLNVPGKLWVFSTGGSTAGRIWSASYTGLANLANLVPPWQGEQEPATASGLGAVFWDRIRAVDPPGPAGSAKPTAKVMRAEVRPYSTINGIASGDVTDTSGYKANRSEVYARFPTAGPRVAPTAWPDPVNSVRWYGFSLYLPDTFKTSTDTKWVILTQWKGQWGGSPRRTIAIDKGQLVLGGTNPQRALGALPLGRWTRLVVGMRHSPDPNVGWVEVYRDGKLMVARRSEATMGKQGSGNPQPGQADPTYFKEGIYRSLNWTGTHVAYFGPTLVGSTKDSVSP